MDVSKLPKLAIAVTIATVITAIMTPIIAESIEAAELTGTAALIAGNVITFLWLVLFIGIAYALFKAD
jgi:hypothetical protein